MWWGIVIGLIFFITMNELRLAAKRSIMSDEQFDYEYVPAQLWWVIGSRYHHGGYEKKRRVYFSGNPDDALHRWSKDEGSTWHVEVVTQNPDVAEKILGLEA